MLKKIKLMIVSLALVLGAGAPVVFAGSTLAVSNTITESLCDGADGAAGSDSGDCSTPSGGDGDSLKEIANKVVNIFSIIVGIVAIIMIIYGGFRYITSGGDSGKVGNAKNTLIYAIIGLIVVALAQFLVHYVLGTTTEAVQ